MRSVILGLCVIALLLCVVPAYAQTCDVVCKDDAAATVAAADTSACQTECNAFCTAQVPPSSVFSCFWDGANVKGNCDVVCKDLHANHLVLADPDPDACQAWCKTECEVHGGTLACDLKGEPTVPTVSEWGLLVMGLLVLTAGTTVVLRRRTATA